MGFRERYRPTLGSEAAGDTALWPAFLLSCLVTFSPALWRQTENPVVLFWDKYQAGRFNSAPSAYYYGNGILDNLHIVCAPESLQLT